MLDASFDDYGKLYLYKTATGWAYQADMSIRGLLGAQGAQGDRGTQGPQGNSATNLPGPQGDIGDAGHPGALGSQGYQAGASTPGPQGYQGDRGVQGSSSLNGTPAGTGLLYVDSGTLDPTLSSLGLGMEITGASGSRVLVVGPTRPALDANHIHVYKCDEAPGSSALVDSGSGAKNLTLSAGENTNYTLQEARYGSVPWLRSLTDGTSNLIASNSSLGLSFSAITVECVAVWNTIARGSAWRPLVTIRTSSGSSSEVLFFETYNGAIYGGVHKDSMGDTFTTQPVEPSQNIPQHFMFVYDSTLSHPNTVKMYVNGVLTATAYQTQASGAFTSLNYITIGAPGWGGRTTPAAYIRDVRISNIARSAEYAMEMANALTHL
jgi:hypothetical protein